MYFAWNYAFWFAHLHIRAFRVLGALWLLCVIFWLDDFIGCVFHSRGNVERRWVFGRGEKFCAQIAFSGHTSKMGITTLPSHNSIFRDLFSIKTIRCGRSVIILCPKKYLVWLAINGRFYCFGLSHFWLWHIRTTLLGCVAGKTKIKVCVMLFACKQRICSIVDRTSVTTVSVRTWVAWLKWSS